MADQEYWGLVVLALAWLGYFVLHSALASLQVKRWVAHHNPEKMPLYRVAYNGLAVLLLLPIVYLMLRYPGPLCWAWRGPLAWLANALALAAIGAFVVSLKYYDSREFLGLRQWALRHRQAAACVEDQEAFHLSPMHRYVRHPWYFFSLVLIWTRDMNAATLISAVMMSAYFIVGARLEEAKLLIYHGAVYQRYMERVAGLLPLPWKTLSAEDGAELLRAARRTTG